MAQGHQDYSDMEFEDNHPYGEEGLDNQDNDSADELRTLKQDKLASLEQEDDIPQLGRYTP